MTNQFIPPEIVCRVVLTLGVKGDATVASAALSSQCQCVAVLSAVRTHRAPYLTSQHRAYGLHRRWLSPRQVRLRGSMFTRLACSTSP
eukprot:scaffold30755_cov36-Prasinocladus_malaysianus.AAC.1